MVKGKKGEEVSLISIILIFAVIASILGAFSYYTIFKNITANEPVTKDAFKKQIYSGLNAAESVKGDLEMEINIGKHIYCLDPENNQVFGKPKYSNVFKETNKMVVKKLGGEIKIEGGLC